MRTKLIAVCMLLALSTGIQSTEASIVLQGLPPSQHHHPALPHHACCPTPLPAPAVPLPAKAPNKDHRCCFLRGPAPASLPISAATLGKPGLAGQQMATAATDPLRDGNGPFVLFLNYGFPPPHSLQMSVVLRS